MAPGARGRGEVAIAAKALCEGELRVVVGVRELEGLEMEMQSSERILRGLREQVTHWELSQLRVRERKESPLLLPGVLKAVLGRRNELELWSVGEVEMMSMDENTLGIDTESKSSGSQTPVATEIDEHSSFTTACSVEKVSK